MEDISAALDKEKVLGGSAELVPDRPDGSACSRAAAGQDKVDDSAVLLSDQFAIFPRYTNVFNVKLTPLKLEYSRKVGRATCINLRDVLGCHLMKGRATDDWRAYICVYSYSTKKEVAGVKCKTRRAITFTISKHRTYDENLAAAQTWRVAILSLAESAGLSVQRLKEEDFSLSCLPPPKQVLVLVNPFGGQGKGLQLFQERVVPVFAEAAIFYKLVVTEKSGHATEIARNIQPEDWHGIVIVSGDGLVFEVIQGLMQRVDWQTAIRLPIGTIPAGSGNGLHASVSRASGYDTQNNFVQHCALVIARGQPHPMDLVAVQMCTGHTVYSFLSVVWGIIADIDIESEKYRKLGQARFTIGAITRILNLKSYRGRLSYLPAKGYRVPTDCKEFPSHRLSHSRSMTTNMEKSEAKLHAPPECCGDVGDDVSPADKSAVHFSTSAVVHSTDTDTGPSGQHLSPDQLLTDLTTGGGGGGGDQSAPQVVNNINKVVRNDKNDNREDGRCEGNCHGPTTPLLPALDKDVPSDWITVEDNFVGINACYQSHLSSDVVFIPHSRLDDGVIHLVLIRGQVTKSALISVLLTMESGQHLNNPICEFIPCTAFRLTPLCVEGKMAVDGELVEYGPVQAQVLPGMARVLLDKQ